MTLSRLLRDYLYIPLGGNRKGKIITYRNLMLTMLIGGLWHGAGWTFVVWGGIHGVGLAVEHWRKDRPGYVAPANTRRRRIVARVVTFNIVCLAWVFFRADSFATAWDMLTGLVHATGAGPPRSSRAACCSRSRSGIGSQYLPARLPYRDHGPLRPAAGRRAGARARDRSDADEHHGAGGRWHHSSTSASDGTHRIRPKLPRLPPIRESAEDALPRCRGDEPRSMPRSRPIPEDAAARAARSEARRRPRARSPARARADRSHGRRSQPSRRRTTRRTRRGRKTDDASRRPATGSSLRCSALVFGALLIAPGMHKSSFNGQPGTKRDVTLALTGALAGVSHALLLDRPRKARPERDRPRRRRRDRRRDRRAADGRDAEAGRQPTTQPPSRWSRSPRRSGSSRRKKKLRLWIAGDSLVITPGYSIVRAAGGSPVIESVGGVDGHVATGLTRPDVFNWFSEIATQ